MDEDKKRTAPVNQQQKQMLVDFVQNHPAVGKVHRRIYQKKGPAIVGRSHEYIKCYSRRIQEELAAVEKDVLDND
nr:unnamed protein product [Callosobruchus analis]